MVQERAAKEAYSISSTVDHVFFTYVDGSALEPAVEATLRAKFQSGFFGAQQFQETKNGERYCYKPIGRYSVGTYQFAHGVEDMLYNEACSPESQPRVDGKSNQVDFATHPLGETDDPDVRQHRRYFEDGELELTDAQNAVLESDLPKAFLESKISPIVNKRKGTSTTLVTKQANSGGGDNCQAISQSDFCMFVKNAELTTNEEEEMAKEKGAEYAVEWRNNRFERSVGLSAAEYDAYTNDEWHRLTKEKTIKLHAGFNRAFTDVVRRPSALRNAMRHIIQGQHDAKYRVASRDSRVALALAKAKEASRPVTREFRVKSREEAQRILNHFKFCPRKETRVYVDGAALSDLSLLSQVDGTESLFEDTIDIVLVDVDERIRGSRTVTNDTGWTCNKQTAKILFLKIEVMVTRYSYVLFSSDNFTRQLQIVRLCKPLHLGVSTKDNDVLDGITVSSSQEKYVRGFFRRTDEDGVAFFRPALLENSMAMKREKREKQQVRLHRLCELSVYSGVLFCVADAPVHANVAQNGGFRAAKWLAQNRRAKGAAILKARMSV